MRPTANLFFVGADMEGMMTAWMQPDLWTKAKSVLVKPVVPITHIPVSYNLPVSWSAVLLTAIPRCPAWPHQTALPTIW